MATFYIFASKFIVFMVALIIIVGGFHAILCLLSKNPTMVLSSQTKIGLLLFCLVLMVVAKICVNNLPKHITVGRLDSYEIKTLHELKARDLESESNILIEKAPFIGLKDSIITVGDDDFTVKISSGKQDSLRLIEVAEDKVETVTVYGSVVSISDNEAAIKAVYASQEENTDWSDLGFIILLAAIFPVLMAISISLLWR